MDLTSWLAIASTILGSSTISAVATVWLTRKKTSAETVEVSVRTALSLEERAHDRYKTTSEALGEAELLLNTARRRIRELENEKMELKRLLLEHTLGQNTNGNAE